MLFRKKRNTRLPYHKKTNEKYFIIYNLNGKIKNTFIFIFTKSSKKYII